MKPVVPGLLMLSLILLGSESLAKTYVVKPGQRIQAVLDLAEPGSEILLEYGRYDENLVIRKDLTLRGVRKNNLRPVLSGNNRADVIRIQSPDVHIEQLIIRDSGDQLKQQNAGVYIWPGSHRAQVRYCDLSYNLFGLWIEKSDDVLIENNLITGKREYNSALRGNGVQLYNTQRARIIGNQISFVRDALYVDVSHNAIFKNNRLHHSRYGTHYMNSYHNLWEGNDSYANRGGLALMEVRDNIVRNNRTWGNSDHGIMLRTMQDSQVENNVIAGNQRGLFIYDAEYLKLQGNLIIDNQVGVHLAAGSTHNQVDNNDFIGNRQQVRYVGSRDEVWGGPLGNFWSNYLGWDKNSDQRGDIPYEANDLVDRLTWRYPLSRLLHSSPSVQSLRLLSRQFPILHVPGVTETHPRMRTQFGDAQRWVGRHFDQVRTQGRLP